MKASAKKAGSKVAQKLPRIVVHSAARIQIRCRPEGEPSAAAREGKSPMRLHLAPWLLEEAMQGTISAEENWCD